MTQTAIEIREPERTAETAMMVTPMTMIDRALMSNASPDTLEKLLALQERWEANQGRKAFDEAVAAAKAEIPIVEKNATGHNNKRYANFAAYAGAVKDVLARYGLSYRFRTQQTDKITVTCILSHRDGHSEESSLSGPADSSGSKNAIQAIGSTLTYLQRYTLVQALGLAATDDDDGAKSEDASAPITPEQRNKVLDLIDETGSDTEVFCTYLGIPSVADMPTSVLPRALASLERKKKEATRNV